MANLPVPYRNGKLNGHPEKEELQREVSMLHKIVDYEEMMHPYQNSLPPKMTELLAELAMVEKEINRLESQIGVLQAEANPEKQRIVGSNMNKSEHETTWNEKVPFEIKALHFISKAIRGDYHNFRDFSSSENGMNSKRFASRNEKSASHDRGVTLREKVFKRTGMVKHPSPSRPRHQTPGRNRVVDIPSDTSPKALSTPLHFEEDNIQKWAPNKLSENIIKCLIFIFVRLLRASTAMDSTSFSLTFPRNSRQQDPYGIFESKESVVRDIGPYKNLVRFTSTSMDFNCMQTSGFLPLFHKLKNLMDGLQKVDLRFLSHRQKLAFWINMYNACIMHGYLQYGLPSVSSPDKMLTLINQATLNIAGHPINAQTMERFILRKPSGSLEKQIFHSKEMKIHELYGLKTPDPNIAFALCCGTRSSPAVKIYTAEGVTGELERSKLEYLEAAIMVTSTKRMALPELVLRNMRDFGLDMGSLMGWLCHQLPASGCLRKSIVDCFRGGAVVEMIPYQFEFQYLFAI